MARRGVSRWLRWKGLIWCCGCLLTLILLALIDTLPRVLQYDITYRTRQCPPSTLDNEFCISWKPLTVVHGICNCQRKIHVLHDECSGIVLNSAASYLLHTQETYGNSTCSSTATLRGPRQYVLSYTVPVLNEEAEKRINITLKDAQTVYKGWIVRVYTRLNRKSNKVMCALTCAHENLDICDVTEVPEPIRFIPDRIDTGWEWSVLGDPLIDAWETRNLDTILLPRERHAVTQFINSNQCWHLMRDHINHDGSLGGGFVGGKTSYGLNELVKLRKNIFNHLLLTHLPPQLIQDELLSVMKSDVMFHDSIDCWTNYGSIAFPTKREPGTWIGMNRDMLNETIKSKDKISDDNIVSKNTFPFHRLSIKSNTNQEIILNKHEEAKLNVPLSDEELNTKNNIKVCPVKCRPYKHKDWLYC